MEQVSQADNKNRSPFKRRAVLSEEEMGEHPEICGADSQQICACNAMSCTRKLRHAACSGYKPWANVHCVHAAEMPDFEIPVAEAEFTGDPADKKSQMAHRKQLAQLELQVQCKKVQSSPAPVTCHPAPMSSLQHAACTPIMQWHPICSAQLRAGVMRFLTQCHCPRSLAVKGHPMAT